MLRGKKRPVSAVTPFAALGLVLMVPGPASADPAGHEPAPSCVEVYESWRYTEAANNCADTLSVLVVYEDGGTSRCSTLAPGTRATVGEGYLGRHGRADHLVLCGAS